MTERQKRILDLHNLGKSSKEISQAIGDISPSAVTWTLRNVFKIGKGKRNVVSTELKEKAKDMYLSGVSSEVIAKELNISPDSVLRYVKKQNIEIRPANENKRKFIMDVDFFEKIDSEHKAYFLGFMYSDGNVSKSNSTCKIILKKDDFEILQKLSNFIYGKDRVTFGSKKLNDKNYDYCSLVFTSQKIKNDLILNGCVPAKSNTIKFPDKIHNKYINHFIRGFFDGDGSISKTNLGKDKFRYNVVFTSNLFFISGLKDKLKEFGIESYVVKYNNEQQIKDGEAKTHDLYIGNEDNIRKIYDFMYKDQSICLERKYTRFLEFLNKERKIKLLNYKGNDLNSDYLKNQNDESLKNIQGFVFNYYREKGFPYPKYDYNHLIDDFKNLKNLDTNKTDKILTEFSRVGLDIFYHFSPHFFDIKPGDNKKKSMKEAFDDDDCLRQVIKNRIEDNKYNVTDNMLRQGLKNSYVSFKASVFHPAIAKNIYKRYCKENSIIYDYSMGFGQRLMSAMSLDFPVHYIGVDPMQKTFETNKNIFNFLNENKLTKSTCDLYCSGSEDFTNEKYINKVDVAFSSPPYFDLEIYDKNNKQANLNGYDYFINVWWKNTVENIHNMLKQHGKFIINMEEIVGDKSILNDMLDICKKYNFVEIDRLFIKLNRNNKFGNGKEKLEPIVIMEKI